MVTTNKISYLKIPKYLIEKKNFKKSKNILDLFREMDKYKSCPKLNFIFDFWQKMIKKEIVFSVPFFS